MDRAVRVSNVVHLAGGRWRLLLAKERAVQHSPSWRAWVRGRGSDGRRGRGGRRGGCSGGGLTEGWRPKHLFARPC